MFVCIIGTLEARSDLPLIRQGHQSLLNLHPEWTRSLSVLLTRLWLADTVLCSASWRSRDVQSKHTPNNLSPSISFTPPVPMTCSPWATTTNQTDLQTSYKGWGVILCICVCCCQLTCKKGDQNNVSHSAEWLGERKLTTIFNWRL